MYIHSSILAKKKKRKWVDFTFLIHLNNELGFKTIKTVQDTVRYAWNYEKNL